MTGYLIAVGVYVVGLVAFAAYWRRRIERAHLERTTRIAADEAADRARLASEVEARDEANKVLTDLAAQLAAARAEADRLEAALRAASAEEDEQRGEGDAALAPGAEAASTR